MAKIYKLFRYYFFRLWQWNLRAFGAEHIPIARALIILSLFSFLHFLIVELLLQKLFFIPVFDFLQVHKAIAALEMLTIFGINYFLFIFNGKTQKALTEFENLSQPEENNLKRASNLYILIIIALFILSVLLFVT